MNQKILILCLAGLATPAYAVPFEGQLHGFASQGYVLTEGNNFFGDSQHDGSLEFYEAGVNASVEVRPGLSLAAQGVIRDAGNLDTGKPRLDFALVDYRFLSRADFDIGIRAGRVKNPIGLYNDTRDLVFTRPSILLPQSVYFEGLGIRSLIFSSDGAQLYGRYSAGAHDLSWTISHALNSNLSDEEVEQLGGGSGAIPPGHIHLDQYYLGQVRDDWSSGRVTVALTNLHARLSLQDSPLPIELSARVNLYVLSGRYNAEAWSVTAEYIQTRSHSHDSFTGRSKSISDGFYVQGDYRFHPGWSAFARFDATFSNIHDRDGSDYAEQTGLPKSGRYARDITLGLNWRYDEHWGVWAEAHSISGTATVPALDNPDGADDPHWQLFTVMVGYRF